MRGFFRCRNCGAVYEKRYSFCSKCFLYNTIEYVVESESQQLHNFSFGRLKGEPQSSDKLKNLRRPYLLLGDYSALGKLPRVFSALVYGRPGGGKTTFLLKLADILAKPANPVLFVSAEEGLGFSLSSKLDWLEIANPNLIISSALDASEVLEDLELQNFRALFIDSLTVLPDLIPFLPRLQETKKLALVFSLHITKGGDYAGSTKLAHACDLIVWVDKLRFKVEKSRYGSYGEGAVLNSFEGGSNG